MAGLDIPESGRLVAVADFFDALTMKRAYRDAWPLDRVLATLKEGSGIHFDPAMLDAFLAILPTILDIGAPSSPWLKSGFDSIQIGVQIV